MGINISKITGTILIDVLVQFQNASGTATEGSYKGEFRRPSQEELDYLLDPENEVRNTETIEKFLIDVRGVGEQKEGGGIEELPGDRQLAWVMASPECVNAGAAAFLRAFRPVRYEGKTSKR